MKRKRGSGHGRLARTRTPAKGKARANGARRGDTASERGTLVALAHEIEIAGADATPRLAGGDVDADWLRAATTGEEAVGGSAATPDQDVVDEIGAALGVEHPDEAELYTSAEILANRDRLRWHLERVAADVEEGRTRRRP